LALGSSLGVFVGLREAGESRLGAVLVTVACASVIGAQPVFRWLAVPYYKGKTAGSLLQALLWRDILLGSVLLATLLASLAGAEAEVRVILGAGLVLFVLLVAPRYLLLHRHLPGLLQDTSAVDGGLPAWLRRRVVMASTAACLPVLLVLVLWMSGVVGPPIAAMVGALAMTTLGIVVSVWVVTHARHQARVRGRPKT